ncbi:MAG: hypothetical protein ABFD77_03410 [Thermotogota bacterium]
MNGRRRSVAPPQSSFAIFSMASSRFSGGGTPISTRRAFSRSRVMMLTLTFQFFRPLNSSV